MLFRQIEVREPDLSLEVVGLPTGQIRASGGYDHTPPAISLAGILHRPIHYLATGAPGIFIPWNDHARGQDRWFPMEVFRPFLDQERLSEVLVILGEPYDRWPADLLMQKLARF